MRGTRERVILVLLAVLLVGMAVPRDVEARIPPPRVAIRNWLVQIRKDVPHRFGTCVRQPVNHFHVEVFRHVGGGRYQYLSNFHVGSYRSAGRHCFVVWNNYRPSICAKTCQPGQGGLVYLVRTALFTIAVFFGIAIPAVVLTMLARAIAAPLYWALP